MTSTTQIKTVSQAGWPAGYSDIYAGKTLGVATWMGQALAAAGMEPVIVSVSTEDFDEYDTWGPGHFVTLGGADLALWLETKVVSKRALGTPEGKINLKDMLSRLGSPMASEIR